jgi:hypothetical protein
MRLKIYANLVEITRRAGPQQLSLQFFNIEITRRVGFLICIYIKFRVSSLVKEQLRAAGRQAGPLVDIGDTQYYMYYSPYLVVFLQQPPCWCRTIQVRAGRSGRDTG